MQDIVGLLGAPWITTVMLLTVRIATVLLLTPLLYAVAMPLMVRAIMVVALACIVALPFGQSASVESADVGSLFAAMLREAGIGATLGLGILMAFAGFSLAGRLIDVQVGYGMAQVFDPLTRSRSPVLTAAFGLLAAVFFFIVDGHHALLRGIAYSVERFPVGRGWAGASAAEPLVRHAAALFTLGFALAAPIVLGLLLVEFALGVVSRNLPQMNMLVMGIPVKILVGLLALAVWAAGFSGPAGKLYAGISRTWSEWFAAGGVR
jgi:flagellar biosynthesis protein FliR